MRENLLAIECSAEPSSVALLRDGETTTVSFSGDRGVALFPAIEDLLDEAGCDRADLTAVAVGTGPGSFTGVRIACVAARMLTELLSIPLVALPSYAAAALASLEGPRASEEVELYADARRGSFYYAKYRRCAEGVAAEVEPTLVPASEAPPSREPILPRATELAHLAALELAANPTGMDAEAATPLYLRDL